VFSALGETTAIGKVSEKVVRLQRIIQTVANSFKPFFIGHFEVRKKNVLIGQFTMLLPVKVFMSSWFDMCGLFAGTTNSRRFSWRCSACRRSACDTGYAIAGSDRRELVALCQVA
jgi:hypothetical protein